MRLTILLLAGALGLVCLFVDRPESAQQGPLASRQATRPAVSASPTLTPAAALVLHECAKVVLAGEGIVTMQHLTQIDACAALVRAGILAR